jgi:replication factor C subunit 3/5
MDMAAVEKRKSVGLRNKTFLPLRMFTSSLIGQEKIITTLNKVLEDPPNIFISGVYGSGKTTILHEFISTYFKTKKITPSHESILWLSSEQDRGIHCVRQSVAEFVRHTSATPGIYRWIIVDDADSLPIISQQALRRPMETHSHTTRFIFCSRYSTDLIQPLRSRCMHLELNFISPMELIHYFINLKTITISQEALSIFISILHSPTEIRNACRILRKKFESQVPYEIQANDIVSLISAPSFSLCMELLKAFILKQDDKMLSIFIELWATGISYEDFLHEIDSSITTIGIIPAKESQKIHQILLKGWIYFAQGKTHTLDMMRLFLE